MKVITIGRLKGNDVVIDNDDRVSRHHLQIVQMDDGTYHLIDFGSTNGTYINGNRVQGEVLLDEGDFVRIGDTMLPWTIYFEPDFVSQAQEGVEESTVITQGRQEEAPAQQVTGEHPSGSNVYAVLGFIFAFLPFLSLLGFVFSIIGLISAKKKGKKGLAIAGLILSALSVIILCIIISYVYSAL